MSTIASTERPSRPRFTAQSAFRWTASLQEAAFQAAAAEEISVSDYVRRALRNQLRADGFIPAEPRREQS